MRQPLPRRRLRQVHPARTAPLLLVAQVGNARGPADDLLQGRLRRLRQRRRRRQPRLREHPLPGAALVLRRLPVGRPRQLGTGARPPLRHRRADAGRGRVRGHGAGGRPAQGIRRGHRRRRHLHQHQGRGLLRPARGRGRGPLLRRRGPAADRLHALRQLHGRLPPRGQEHADEELPLVRREARRADRARTAGDRDPPARRGRRLRRLRGDQRALRVLVPQAPPDGHRQGRGRRRRRARHQQPARQLQAQRRPAAALGPDRRRDQDQLGVDPVGHRDATTSATSAARSRSPRASTPTPTPTSRSSPTAKPAT